MDCAEPGGHVSGDAPGDDEGGPGYVLDDQIGYLLRLATQRHVAIFQTHSPAELTPTQFSTLIRLSEAGEVSQNRLGRLAGLDGATIKGVVERLRARGLISARPDPQDKRRALWSLTAQGRSLAADLPAMGGRITRDTAAPLSPAEARHLVRLLRKIT